MMQQFQFAGNGGTTIVNSTFEGDIVVTHEDGAMTCLSLWTPLNKKRQKHSLANWKTSNDTTSCSEQTGCDCHVINLLTRFRWLILGLFLWNWNWAATTRKMEKRILAKLTNERMKENDEKEEKQKKKKKHRQRWKEWNQTKGNDDGNAWRRVILVLLLSTDLFSFRLWSHCYRLVVYIMHTHRSNRRNNIAGLDPNQRKDKMKRTQPKSSFECDEVIRFKLNQRFILRRANNNLIIIIIIIIIWERGRQSRLHSRLYSRLYSRSHSRRHSRRRHWQRSKSTHK